MFGPLLTFYTPSVACLVLALIYPTYVHLCYTLGNTPCLLRVKSVQAIEHPEPQAIAQWLTYWCGRQWLLCTLFYRAHAPGCCLASSPPSRGCWGGFCDMCHSTTYSRRCWCSGLLRRTQRVPFSYGDHTCGRSWRGTHHLSPRRKPIEGADGAGSGYVAKCCCNTSKYL